MKRKNNFFRTLNQRNVVGRCECNFNPHRNLRLWNVVGCDVKKIFFEMMRGGKEKGKENREKLLNFVTKGFFLFF